jgi:PadR family transcriptional regulator, regulatory protein PadR
VASEWTPSENNRRAKYYRVTRDGHKHLEKETSEWQETTAVMERFLSLGKGHA